MINNLKIKVCGMKFPGNCREVEKLPVDTTGFIFYPPSPRNVGNMEERELRELTNTSGNKAAVFVNSPFSEVNHILSRYHFDHVQLHGTESPGYCRQIRTTGVKVIKAFHLYPGFSFEELISFADSADYFLFDTKTVTYGGSGVKFDWKMLEMYDLDIPFFLSGGIGPEDAGIIREFSHPAFCGIDLNSGFEDSPGVKNPGKISFFLENLRGDKGKCKNDESEL